MRQRHEGRWGGGGKEEDEGGKGRKREIIYSLRWLRRGRMGMGRGEGTSFPAFPLSSLPPLLVVVAAAAKEGEETDREPVGRLEPSPSAAALSELVALLSPTLPSLFLC